MRTCWIFSLSLSLFQIAQLLRSIWSYIVHYLRWVGSFFNVFLQNDDFILGHLMKWNMFLTLTILNSFHFYELFSQKHAIQNWIFFYRNRAWFPVFRPLSLVFHQVNISAFFILVILLWFSCFIEFVSKEFCIKTGKLNELLTMLKLFMICSHHLKNLHFQVNSD